MAKRKIKEKTVDGIRRNILEGVGYGKPPKSTRFKKGVSGNPAGRPRKEPVMDAGIRAAILEESKRTVTVQENGGTSQISTRDAVIRSQFKSAAQGNPYAQERFLKRVEQAEKEEMAAIEAVNVAAEIYIATRREEIEAAIQAGNPVPEFLPHPDDVIVEPGKPWKVDGPTDEQTAELIKRACAARDLLLMQHIYEERNGPEGPALVSLALMFIVNQALPKRMQLDESAVSFSRFRRLPNAKLQKLIREALRELDVKE